MDRATLSDVMAALEDRPHGREDGRGAAIRSWARNEISWDMSRREAYSYGRHFPLFRYVPRAVSGRRPLYVINGDTWNGGGGWHRSRTPDHQEMVRDFTAGTDSLILPFSALEGAGIDLDTVRPIHVRPDVWLTVDHEVRTLDEVPRWRRTEEYSVTLEAESLEQVPDRHRRDHRRRTAEELAEWQAEEHYGRPAPDYAESLPRLPDTDGRYRWTETRRRPIAPDSDGFYRWSEQVHRLGDSLFSAVRTWTETRPARPFEAARDDTRGAVRLDGARDGGRWSEWCDGNEARNEHEAGPAAECVHCGAALRATVTIRRRARFLSSFDTNEAPPLYFLCQVPRGAGDTVDTALDSLAPRAVHAAIARGREVRRQGDLFFVDTDLTRAELEARGAVFARLTQWDRGAAPRPNEATYRPRPPAPVRRRRAALEASYRRRLFRESIRAELAGAVFHERAEQARAAARAAARVRWSELEARQAEELEQAAGRPDVFGACHTCGAAIGAPCAHDVYRRPLETLHVNERETLRRELERRPYEYSARPNTGANDRRRAARARAAAADTLETAREDLRRAVFRGPARGKSRYQWENPGATYAQSVIGKRRALEIAEERYRACLLVPMLGARDGYRGYYRGRALELFRQSTEAAREKYQPETVFNSARWSVDREAVRRALSVYGTAHSATQVARAGGAVYVSGTVRHVPALERGRGGTPDHRPLTLTPDRWYLAVRNTVPRARRQG